jgi:predicted peptidase
MLRHLAVSATMLAFVLAIAHAADNDKTGFLDRVYKDGDKESKYVLFIPHDYKGDKEYPLILFLHGAGESGTDGKKQAAVGLAPAIRKREKTFPFIAVFPQADKAGRGSWAAESPYAQRALKILEQVQKDYKVDAKRIYLTGLSMGGYGTWSLAPAYPTKWAAIVPICGAGDPASAPKFKDVPCWAFHGDKDGAVKVEGSRDMIKSLKDAGGSPKYTEYPGVGHNSWDMAYGTDELYDWLLAQKLK